MARVASGEEVLVTLRGKPYVRLLPAIGVGSVGHYPLRGSVVAMAEDFDAPLSDLWEALEAPPRRRKKP